MLTLLAKLFHALNSDSSIRQIALAIALGFVFALAPFFSLHNWVILFFVLLIKVHLGSFILSVGFFSALSYLLSSLIVWLGESLLTAPALNSFFTTMYQFTWFKLAHWHHTYTFGALVLGLVLSVPIYFLAKVFVEKYRVHIMAFFQKFKIVQALKASKFYKIYLSISGNNMGASL